jgi:hypothetical protein
MTHVNLDTPGEGAILESAGRPVACLVAAPQSTEGNSRAEEWTEEQNRRRCELIDRKYDHGLSPAEEAELALLQNAMYRFIDKVAPLPLDAARRLHQELLEKAARAADTNNP